MSDEITKDELKDIFGYDEAAEAAKAAEKAAILTEQLAKQREEARQEAFERLRTEASKLEAVREERVDYESSTQDTIREICDGIRDFLLDKNAQYGDSAINPVRIFSKASPIEQLLVRIDDKLSRIEKGDDRIESDDDVIDDLIGYFILLKVAKAKGLS